MSGNPRGRGQNSWRGGQSNWRGGRGGWRGRWRGRGGNRGMLMDLPTSQSSPPSIGMNSSQLQINTMLESTDCPFKAWKVYLPAEKYNENSETVTKIRAVQKFYKSMFKSSAIDDLYTKRFFDVDLKILLADNELLEAWEDLPKDLDDHGERVVGILGLARHQMVTEEIREQAAKDAAGIEQSFLETNFPIVRARIQGHKTTTPIKDLKASFYGKLVTLHGTVVRVSNIKPICTWLAFECAQCLTVQSVQQPDGKFQQPPRCPGPACRSHKFKPLRSHKLTLTVDWQSVRLQEIVQHESGRVPRTIEAELTEDLCDTSVPGDVVTLTGVVKTVTVENKNAGGRMQDRCMFHLYIHALSVRNSKTKSGAKGGRTSNIGMEFTMLDYSAIQDIYALGPMLFKLFVASLCPSIYGHELVKAGLLLALFGGTSKYASDRSHIPVRGDPHVLVVGDPGLGKSQMLTACASVAPRGVFVTGNTTTSSGLTVTLSKESGNDFTLEAGALVLADQGCCCIDEFDKMSSQHQALLEAMEQQAVSIAKSGVVASLPARTAVLAAANPVGGHYNRAKTVAENLKLSPALLSRFDLVFILIDKPNEELDGLLSDHIMNLHAGASKRRKLNRSTSDSSACAASSICSDLDQPLSERLQKRPGEEVDVLPQELLRKYIAYARRYVFPKLTNGACDVLQQFYLELRQKHQTSDATPITLRQLESLLRLTEARAKMELREDATEQDALDVVEIMRSSMVDSFADDLGSLDFTRSQNGSGMSSRSKAKKFIGLLQRQADLLQKNIFSIDEMKQLAHSRGIQVNNFFDFLSSLNNQGYLIKKSSKVYQLLSVEY